jgi:predicted DNA-binding protein (MmcQ/YjbR family)
VDHNLTKRDQLLRNLRQICLELPESKETLKWGNPTFVAGKKMFAVLDRYKDRWCIAFVATLEEQELLVAKPGFFPAPYAAKYGWVCCDAEGKLNWKEMEKLITGSYRLVALKRMLKALEESAAANSNGSSRRS